MRPTSRSFRRSERQRGPVRKNVSRVIHSDLQADFLGVIHSLEFSEAPIARPFISAIGAHKSLHIARRLYAHHTLAIAAVNALTCLSRGADR